MTTNNDVLDWDELEPEDQDRAEELLRELNALFDRNFQRKKKEARECDDSTSTD